MTDLVKIRFVGTSIEVVSNAFIKRGKRLVGTRKANIQARTVIEKWTRKNIKNEGRDQESKHKWPKLKASTIASRRRGPGKGTPKMLQDTGFLLGNWERSSTSKEAILRSAAEYSSVHEFGKGRVPQRKIFPSNDKAKELILPVYEKFVNESIK